MATQVSTERFALSLSCPRMLPMHGDRSAATTEANQATNPYRHDLDFAEGNLDREEKRNLKTCA
jgi:hypothetical protein